MAEKPDRSAVQKTIPWRHSAQLPTISPITLNTSPCGPTILKAAHCVSGPQNFTITSPNWPHTPPASSHSGAETTR